MPKSKAFDNPKQAERVRHFFKALAGDAAYEFLKDAVAAGILDRGEIDAD